MKKLFLLFGLAVVIIVSFFIYNYYNQPTDILLSFTWNYEPADTLNLDGLPNTNVFLEALYSNQKIVRKLIATVPGGCNDLPDNEPGSVPNSKNAQCYSAGLGYRFKVIQGVSSYLVQQKEFEEGLPDYTPPETQYGTVSEFPFKN